MSAECPQLIFVSADETARHAALLGTNLRDGDTLLLSGEVGAGKTHFARSLIQSLMAQPEDVPSPTFTLVQTYETKVGEVWHADLYRLTSTLEIEELGLTEAFDSAICLVEWPDRLGPLAPDDALELIFEEGETEDQRRITLNWTAPKWHKKLLPWLS
ncbi:MAG: tRNA (adenosine(37)-N6)-threonylcarbamoyltransferase complex ATPase subunit type 1 TsaE [Sulfitobacter sp.]|nr:tRNA (adenosine(37)-N6)-threonylcarbamoyltransferase complex ATPase subunit type 1 TsaE [Sulfitobacter sp.]